MSKNHSLYVLLLFTLSFFGSIAAAQTNSGFERITTAQGLSQGLINDMLQDREGFIWIATKGGLNRYDGYSFKVFTTDPQDSNSISSNTVSNLLEDSKGRIWVGTLDGGVNVYDKRTGHFLRILQKANDFSGLSGNRIVSAMLELPDGRILVCPEGASMSIISLSVDLSKAPVITRVNAPENREILGVGKDDKGHIWLGCTDETIFIFTPATASFEMLTDGRKFSSLIEKVGSRLSFRSSQAFFLVPVPANPIQFQDSSGQLKPGNISYGTNGDVLLNNHYPIKKGPSGNSFFDFSGLKSGSGVAETRSNYLYSFDYEHTIKCLLLDRSGVLWVGMLGQGLYKYRIGSQVFKPILPNLSVQRMAVLDNRTIYVHGWRSIKTITPEGTALANPLQSVIGERIGAIVLKTLNGEYWIYDRDQKKMLRYSAELKLLHTYEKPVSPKTPDHLQSLLEDHKSRIWVCGNDGTLARIDPRTGKLSRFQIANDRGTAVSSSIPTNTFYEDGNGVFWLGTEHGFARLRFTDDTRAPEVKWFKNKPGNPGSLSYNYVSSFMDDPADFDYLWISTKGGGLNRMQKSTGKFTHYTTRQGLPNDVVYGTLIDHAGNIWGSTNSGLFCMLSGTWKDNKPAFRVFSTSDGLQADEFNTNAFAKLSNGDLVFGGVNGINIFDPKKVLAASFMPNVFITGILIGNKMVTPDDQTGVLKQTIEKTSSIILSYLQDVVTLEFSSLDFTAPDKNKYRYQLAGIDKEWVESGTRRTATYLHLPSGNYVFKVQGSNSQGIWSNHIAELRMRVLPPWWLTWWAYLSYILILALSIRGYLKFNVNKARLQSQLSNEQLEAKRMKELDAIKTQLYTNITHEFRTPLTVILGMAQQVIEKPAELFETRMDMIVSNGRSLLNLVNQMLDLSKLESGKMRLQLSDGDVIQFLRYVVESFHSLAESEQKQLHFLADMDALYMEYDREKLRQIISNLLSNAVKFTPQKGNIYISVAENMQSGDMRDPTLIIKVKDTGIGIPEDQLHYVFDRFYQLDHDQAHKKEGTGIGLALTKELVKLMGGEITVKSPPGGALIGAEFTVAIPLKRVAPVMDSMLNEFGRRPAAVAIAAPDFAPPVISDNGLAKAPLILLVEDNADVRAYTASCLSDYRLVMGTDGREGLNIAADVIPDLIITDVMMPFVDGYELVSKLRANESTSHIPIIMLTARADIGSKIEGLREGADVYLEKPFNKEELQVRVEKLLEMRRNLQYYYLKKAGIQGDLTEDEVFRPGKSNVEAMEDAFVKRVRAAITQNLADVNFTVEQLSKLVFLSHSQLHRKLDALTGVSPNKFIRMIRLKKAKELLQDPALTVAAVAMECGYDDPAYFTRVFRQEFNSTPQKWRASNS